MSKKTLGPVTRDHYETIIKGRIKAAIDALNEKIKDERLLAINRALKNLGLDKIFQAYEKASAEMLAAFPRAGEKEHRLYNVRNGLTFDSFVATNLVKAETDKLLRAKPSLTKIFEDIDRLNKLSAGLHERVWLADAPEEIKAMLNEI